MGTGRIAVEDNVIATAIPDVVKPQLRIGPFDPIGALGVPVRLTGIAILALSRVRLERMPVERPV